MTRLDRHSGEVSGPTKSRLTLAFTLIELLVVIGIIAILAGLILPAVGTAQRKARETQAQVDVKMIEAAWKAYYREYNRWPVLNLANYSGDETDDGIEMLADVVALLSGTDYNGMNPREVRFMEFPQARLDDEGSYVDPWDDPYKFMVDFNQNNIVEVRFTNDDWQTNLARNVAAWSRGADQSDEFANSGDDIVSWK